MTNDTLTLQPVIPSGGRALALEGLSLEIGVAEYREGPTGCTVFAMPPETHVTTDVRGGSAGVLLAGDGWTDAICFAGGSLYGLEACAGVAAELLARRGYSTDSIPVVRGAIIYDFHRRSNSVYPDKALGRAALRAAADGAFPLGRRGAGCSAGVGAGLDWSSGESAGQGAALHRLGPTTVAVFVVVNAIGCIVDRDGQVVRGHMDHETGRRTPLHAQIGRAASEPEEGAPTRSTTLTLLATNQKLSPMHQAQLGRQVHASLARAIQPFHTPFDGDTLFTATTNEVDNPSLPSTALGAVASELAWDAVLSCYDE